MDRSRGVERVRALGIKHVVSANAPEPLWFVCGHARFEASAPPSSPPSRPPSMRSCQIARPAHLLRYQAGRLGRPRASQSLFVFNSSSDPPPQPSTLLLHLLTTLDGPQDEIMSQRRPLVQSSQGCRGAGEAEWDSRDQGDGRGEEGRRMR